MGGWRPYPSTIRLSGLRLEVISACKTHNRRHHFECILSRPFALPDRTCNGGYGQSRVRFALIGVSRADMFPETMQGQGLSVPIFQRMDERRFAAAIFTSPPSV